MEEEFIEIFGVRCYKEKSSISEGDFRGSFNKEISIFYMPPNKYKSLHQIFIYGEVHIANGAGNSLDEAIKNLSPSLKKTIDNINLIKGRIL